MSFTKTTVRALAASVAIVAAGATVASAAVFQLPILGFGHADVASANVGSRVARPVVPKKVHPKVVVKIRYVDDIVHRPAPVRAYSGRSANAPARTVSWSSYAKAPSVAPVTTTTAATAPASTPRPHTATARPGGGDPHESEHEAAPTVGHGGTPSTQAPAGDQ